MKHSCFFLTALLFFFTAMPMLMAQQSENHFEVGAFADYFRFNDPGPLRNFVGLGGRAAFNVSPSVQIEGEMGYDFKRNYTNTFTNGVTTTFVTSSLRPLHGFFGPKFQTRGPVRLFVTGKVGFENFSATTQNAPTGFSNSVALTSGATYFALYPGGGIEAFAGPFGVRAEAGDDIFFNNGGHNNLRVTFGPQFRF
jgi:hypothetical protein